MQMRKKLRQIILLAFLLSSVLFFRTRAEAAGTGWFEEGGKWYYTKDNGNKATGWQEIKNKWYYFDLSTGVMKTGWQEIKGKWYYFDPESGRMKTGWLEIKNKWYYFDSETGRMTTGWKQVGKFWYYFDPATGRMTAGWKAIGNAWYYFDLSTGRMATGWKQIGNAWYYFDPSTGRMVTGWKQVGNAWYYFDPSTGRMATGWKTVGDVWYYFDALSGKRETGWQTIGKARYYLDPETGAMATSWISQGGKKYYMKETGAMACAEVLVLDGKRQGFSGAGDWLGEKSSLFMDAYGAAVTFVAENTDASWSKEKKLRVCFDLFATDFHEKNPWIPHYTGTDWAEKYAYNCITTKSGNCFSYGAAFAFMARAIGYDDVYACSSGGHGWAEVGGLVYDPEWTQYQEGNFFGRPLKKGDSPNYLGVIVRTGDNWTYRRI